MGAGPGQGGPAWKVGCHCLGSRASKSGHAFPLMSFVMIMYSAAMQMS